MRNPVSRNERTARRPLAWTATAVTAAAAVGAAGTRDDSGWYRSLDKPSWQPPDAAFGPVWTVLYALMSWASARALRAAADGGARRRYAVAFTANLALNAGWTWSFFRARRPRLAVAEVLVLQASTVDLVRRTWRLDRVAGLALLPYAGWVTFATALTATIARRNPRH